MKLHFLFVEHYPLFRINHSLGQNIVEKLEKLRKVGFSLEICRIDFLQFRSAAYQKFLFGRPTGHVLLIPSVCSATRTVT